MGQNGDAVSQSDAIDILPEPHEIPPNFHPLTSKIILQTKEKMSTGFQRGPRAGDAKSLWNFSSSPGWTREETRILQLCLMKYGVGEWTAILNTGLLPGKVVGQLNSQTQRLLGQQSLAVFSRLRVDVDRIHKDNAAKTKVTRKGGVIINTGNKLSAKEKEKRKKEASEIYGLTEEQLKEVERKLEKVKAALVLKKTQRLGHSFSSLLDCDSKKLNRSERIKHLEDLRQELKLLEKEYSTKQEKKSSHVGQDLAQSQKKTNTVKMKTQCLNGTHRHKRQKKQTCSVSDEEPSSFEPLEASVMKIMELGYSRRHAVDALYETENVLEDAVQWLIHNCS